MKKIITNFTIFVAMGIFFATFLSGIPDAEARAGRSSSRSGKGDGTGSVVVTAIAVLYYAIYEIRRQKMLKKAKKDLADALKDDSTWKLDWLKEVTKTTFLKYQDAWMEKNLEPMRPYMTDFYYQKAQKILAGEAGLKNIMENIHIDKMQLMSVRNYPGKDGDMFAMEIEGSMIDYTIRERDGTFVSSPIYRNKYESLEHYENRAKTQSVPFTEYYIFIRVGNVWKLNNIKSQFSIIKDIIGLSEWKLKQILEQEKNSPNVNDDLLYQTLADENPENWTAQVIDENQEKSPKKRKNEPINEQDNPFFPK